ncbi:MAG: hypothetical protein J7L32_01130 [Thermoplasmata archaeon]|nr:MAG: hypothetical protein FE039_03030 [Thermoplasmata archaeon]MCD6467903.1 hypothetical protein [Thermoplasmata archaeon]
MTVLTLDDLSRAIANRIGISIEEARKDALFVMDIFGFDDRVIDNVLDPEGRQLFYILEEEGMLSTEREETTLYDGREWRTHYWQLRKDVILKYSKERKKIDGSIIPIKQTQDGLSEEETYESLDDEIWISRKKRD